MLLGHPPLPRLSRPSAQTVRNLYSPAPGLPFGFGGGRISIFSQCPDSVFPVGQARGFSSATQHKEFFTVTVKVVVAKGCDELLVKLAQDLVGAGIVIAQMPKVGQTISGGDSQKRN